MTGPRAAMAGRGRRIGAGDVCSITRPTVVVDGSTAGSCRRRGEDGGDVNTGGPSGRLRVPAGHCADLDPGQARILLCGQQRLADDADGRTVLRSLHSSCAPQTRRAVATADRGLPVPGGPTSSTTRAVQSGVARAIRRPGPAGAHDRSGLPVGRAGRLAAVQRGFRRRIGDHGLLGGPVGGQASQAVVHRRRRGRLDTVPVAPRGGGGAQIGGPRRLPSSVRRRLASAAAPDGRHRCGPGAHGHLRGDGHRRDGDGRGSSPSAGGMAAPDRLECHLRLRAAVEPGAEHAPRPPSRGFRRSVVVRDLAQGVRRRDRHGAGLASIGGRAAGPSP